MRQRLFAAMGILTIVLIWTAASTAAGPTPAAGGKAQPPAKHYMPPRTADGHPDLQGVWDFRSGTPLERPEQFAGKEFLTDQDIKDYEKQIAEQRNQDRRDKEPRGKVNGEETTGDVARAYNDFWWDFGKKVVDTRRSSLIVDPPDGKIPALTPMAQHRAAERAEQRERIALGPEDRGIGERCIMGFNSGPPMLPSAYNNNMQLLQGSNYVVIVNEMVHNPRIVPLDGRPHSTIPQLAGDSRGRWDGDTLVVDTVNFYSETSFQNSSPKMHLVERFSRVGPDTLMYEFTVEDPTTWTRPWSAQVPMLKNSEHMYEYACHEGNYGMFNLLSAARATDKELRQVATKKESN